MRTNLRICRIRPSRFLCQLSRISPCVGCCDMRILITKFRFVQAENTPRKIIIKIVMFDSAYHSQKIKPARGRFDFLVGVTGIEPATPCTPCKYSTRLSYTPTTRQIYTIGIQNTTNFFITIFPREISILYRPAPRCIMTMSGHNQHIIIKKERA